MRILVTAGPTREPIDPVRFISNRSSGKMGYAVARAAKRGGHEVVLISGPVSIPAPAGVELVRVSTVAEMLAAVESRLAWCEALVMAAAPADWRPKQPAAHKLKKRDQPLTLELEPAPDILKSIRDRKGSRTVVGFAAETDNLEQEAVRKLCEKGLDLIVANDVSAADAGFEVDTNRVVLFASDGRREAPPLMSKDAVAERIIAWVERRRAGGAAG